MTRAGIEYVATVNAHQANLSLGELEAHARAVGGASGGAAAQMGALEQRVKDLQPRVEKAAAATSGLSAVVGGLGGKAGQAFGAVSNLAQAFLVGGPWLLGIAAVTTGVGLLVDQMHKKEAATQKAIEQADAIERAIREKEVKAYQELADEIDSTRKAVENYGLTHTAVRAKEIEAEILKTEVLVEQLKVREQQVQMEWDLSEQDEARARRELETVSAQNTFMQNGRKFVDTEAASVKAAMERVRAAEEMADAMRSEHASLGAANNAIAERTSMLQELRGEVTQLLVAEGVDKTSKGKHSSTKTKKKRDPDGYVIEIEGEFEQQLAADMALQAALVESDAETQRQKVLKAEETSKMLATIRKNEQDFAADQLRLETAAHNAAVDAQLQAERKAAEERKRIAKEVADEEVKQRQYVVGQMEQSYGVVVSGIQTLADGMVTGQEDAAEAAAAAVLRGFGAQLVGLGSKATFIGAERLLVSYGSDPTGYGLIALGTGATAAGIGMGAAGAAVANRGAAGASGSSGAPRGGSGSATGAPRGGGGTSTGSGGETGSVTITNNFYGSTAVMGETSNGTRALERAQQRGLQRHFANAGA